MLYHAYVGLHGLGPWFGPLENPGSGVSGYFGGSALLREGGSARARKYLKD